MSHGSSVVPVRLESIGNTVLAALRPVLYTPGSRRDEMKSRRDEILCRRDEILSRHDEIPSRRDEIKSS